MTMASSPIRAVAVVGFGTIGQRWAVAFAHAGLEVRCFDPDPTRWTAFADLRVALEGDLARLRPSRGAGRIVFTPRLAEALAGIAFVQENGPERLDLKQALLADIERHADPGTIIASSSSALLVSAMQARCRHPERIVLGHPFNPAHLMPLVEIVGGDATAPETVARARAFYDEIGKKPVVLNREVTGHLALRLMGAMWREAIALVRDGGRLRRGPGSGFRLWARRQMDAAGVVHLQCLERGRHGVVPRQIRPDLPGDLGRPRRRRPRPSHDRGGGRRGRPEHRVANSGRAAQPARPGSRRHSPRPRPARRPLKRPLRLPRPAGLIPAASTTQRRRPRARTAAPTAVATSHPPSLVGVMTGPSRSIKRAGTAAPGERRPRARRKLGRRERHDPDDRGRQSRREPVDGSTRSDRQSRLATASAASWGRTPSSRCGPDGRPGRAAAGR